MRAATWKVLLSYLTDLPVESVRSATHQELHVSLSRGRYQLSTNNAIYSYGDLYENFARVFSHFDWSRLRGDEVLLLGLGLGSIPFMLEKKFGQNFVYTAVEIDPDVIRLASKYVLSELTSPITTYQADAVDFIAGSSGEWDLICIDIFIDDTIPGPALTIDFLEHLRTCLRTDGLILFNCLSRTSADIERTNQFLDQAFLKVFPDGGILDVGGNWILTNRSRHF